MESKLDIKTFLDNDEKKDLLRFLTAGSVDDGKSTLIGRLLFDSKKIYEDQLDALERDSSWTPWSAIASVWAMPATTSTTPSCWTA